MIVKMIIAVNYERRWLSYALAVILVTTTIVKFEGLELVRYQILQLFEKFNDQGS